MNTCEYYIGIINHSEIEVISGPHLCSPHGSSYPSIIPTNSLVTWFRMYHIASRMELQQREEALQVPAIKLVWVRDPASDEKTVRTIYSVCHMFVCR